MNPPESVPETPGPQSEPRSANAWVKEVYPELRCLAAAKMAAMKPGQTLQPTALVHEAWLRLARDPEASWQSRAHFFATAAEAMRQILIDQVRRKQAGKRGGGNPPEPIEDSCLAAPVPDEELLSVHESVDALSQHDARAGEVIKLRYFVGLTLGETAETLGISARTVGNLWDYGRAWLMREIQRQRRT